MPVLAAPLEALAALGELNNITFYVTSPRILGFILAGIPFYLLTQTGVGSNPDSLFGRFRAWATSLWSETRLRRGGWTRVATEGDGEEVEMSTAPR
jgi:hypothetical protein